MSKTLTLFLACLLTARLSAQPPQALQKAANDAFMISRMVEKFHVQPRPLNDEMSAAMYDKLISELDDQRIFLNQEDITKLSAWRLKLDDEISSRQSTFLQTFMTTFKLRLQQADTMIDNIGKIPFNFTIKEKLTVAEDTSYPAGLAAMHNKLYKLLKLSVLNTIVAAADEKKMQSPTKKFTDSLEPILRKKAITSVKRNIKRVLQSPGGFENAIGSMYCQSLAVCYDPHTDYFPPEIKEEFEGQLGKQTMKFGLSFDEDDDGNVEINNLEPGSSAFQSGQLSKGDKIQSIQYENKEPIDVSNADMKDIQQMLGAPGASKVQLVVKKADGTTRQVTLRKEKLNTDDEDDNRVKSFILKGAKKIGFISLPAFYEDWESNEGVNGCANDVAKEILKLKKENIEGLILDLRYNGGGSMEEAIALAGIFIDAGPVEQIKTREAKILTLKDANRGTVYDGPLMLMVNGFSASASEMVAGTLQDYNRAVIVGSPTYGKATAQIVLPLDTTVNPDQYTGGNSGTGSYIKVTISKLYRLNGTTAQAKGVKPDIALPDIADASSEREVNEKNFLVAPGIDANKYYKPLPLLQLAPMQDAAKKEIESSAYYKEILEYVSKAKAAKQEKDKPLSLDVAWEQRTPPVEDFETQIKPAAKTKDFTVTNHTFEMQRLQANHNLQEMNDEWKDNLLEDPYIATAYKLLSMMIK